MRRRNPDFGTKDLLVVGGVAAAAYFLYQALNKVPKITKTLTAPVANAIATIWNKLTMSPPMSGVLGDVVLPDGTDIGPLANFEIRTDTQSNVYIQTGGAIYQLGQSDAQGNWPAQLVLDPNLGVTGTTW